MKKSFLNKISIKHIFICLALLLVCISVILLIGTIRTDKALNNMQDTMNKYIDGHDAIDEMRNTSDYLTAKARGFVVTGELQEADLYFDEVENSKNRDKAIETIRRNTDGDETYNNLVEAFDRSRELEVTELYAMKLAALGYGIDPDSIGQGALSSVKISAKDAALSDAEKIRKAVDMLFNDEYLALKNEIMQSVDRAKESLIEESHVSSMNSYSVANRISILEHVLTVIILIATGLMLLLTAFSVIIPLQRSADFIKKSMSLPLRGAAEYVYLAETYNTMLEQTRVQHEELSYEATHDELTGLFNRKMFENKKPELEGENCAMLIVDVDHFKQFNDNYGHDVGDKVLKKVADTLTSSFRFEDLVCRIGGDEFTIVMVRVTPEHLNIVRAKIDQVRERLAQPDELPKITLSIGGAFSKPGLSMEGLFKNADTALYATKERGRDGYTIFEYENA